MHEPLITSLLDTDLYKFTMMQCVWHHFPSCEVEYRFQCRKPVDLTGIIPQLQENIAQFCKLQLTETECQYLQTLPFIKPDFMAFLKNFSLDPSQIRIQKNNQLEIIIKGPWFATILFEVPVLAMVSELYYRLHYPELTFDSARELLQEKIHYVKQQTLPGFTFSDFGTRRRFSKAWQKELLTTLQAQLPHQFAGTSNILFAQQLKLPPIGTMAHEFLQACQVLAPDIRGSQKFALQVWLQEYPHSLGIALTDVLTMDVFLQEFDKDLATRFRGLRQDSGDPIIWGEKALRHYQRFGIDAKTKTFVFSNGLTVPKAVQIYQHFKDQVNVTFGIGTNLTNDVGVPALDIVLKMVAANGQPVIKISDSPGKVISIDENRLNYIKDVFHIQDN